MTSEPLSLSLGSNGNGGKAPKQLTLPLEAIRTDGETQPREKLNRTVINDYARAKKEGAEFPPVIVFHDGENYWLADGFHRTEADRKIGAAEVACEVRPGSQRDAQLYSFGANAAHGLRRTNADKRRAVEAMLRDPQWRLWDGERIAQHCVVTRQFVNNLKRKLQTGNSFPPPEPPEEPWSVGRRDAALGRLSRQIGAAWREYASQATEVDVTEFAGTLERWAKSIRKEKADGKD